MFHVIYYTVSSGRKPVEEFIEEQSTKEKVKIMSYLQLLELHGFGLIRPFTAAVEGKLRELRVEYSPNNYRIFYYFAINKNIILLHGVKKKDNKLKRKDIDTAINRMLDFDNRLKKGAVKL